MQGKVLLMTDSCQYSLVYGPPHELCTAYRRRKLQTTGYYECMMPTCVSVGGREPSERILALPGHITSAGWPC